MQRGVSAWAIRNPWPVAAFFALLVVLGLYGFDKLPVTRYPAVDVPVVVVNIADPGAGAPVIEKGIAGPIESALRQVDGVRHVHSALADGNAYFTVQFETGTPAEQARSQVAESVNRIKERLLPDAAEPKVELIDVIGPGSIKYTVNWSGHGPEALSRLIDEVVSPRLKRLDTVAAVERFGGIDRSISVQLKQAELTARDISAAAVAKTLSGLDAGPLLSGGDAASAAQKLGQTPATKGGPALNEVATVQAESAPARSFALLDGENTIAIAVQPARGVSDVSMAEEVKGALAAISSANAGVAFQEVDSSAPFTLGNYHSAMHTLFEGAVLTIAVVLLFLRSMRATLVAALALPLSIIPAFFAMHLLGFSLNLVTLMAITVVTGILVDDAIVAIENIVRHIRLGKTAKEAAAEGSAEIARAITAITLTIVAVFLPVSFMGGIAGQYFQQFGLAVAVAVVCSLLVARLVSPLLAARFLRASDAEDEHQGGLTRRYTGLLEVSLRHRFLTVTIGLVLFALSILSIKLLPAGLLPAEDTSRLLMTMELTEDATLAQTRDKSQEAIELIRAVPGVRSVFVMAGGAGRFSDGRTASLVVRLVPPGDRDQSQKQIANRIGGLLGSLGGIQFWLTNETSGERDVTLSLVSDNAEALSKAAIALRDGMRTLPELANVIASTVPERRQMSINLREEEIKDYGIDENDVFRTLRIATIGDDVATLKGPNDPAGLPVLVTFEGSTPGAPDEALFYTLMVAGKDGSLVPLLDVAELKEVRGPVAIRRLDGKRVITIGADLAEGASLGTALDHIQALPAARNLPAGVALQESGDAEVMRETFASFGIAMGLGMAAVLAILIILFRGVTQPITIIASLPLSIGGAILALLLANKPLDMPVIIGLLMLMGIVTKNAIMLVDFALEAVRRGLERTEAVIDAGRKRARPIIMTTVAMVAGMVPSALGIGEGGEFRSPMAIAVIGGLILSTLLSLIFVPALYTIMDDIGRFFATKFRWKRRDEATKDDGFAARVAQSATEPARVRMR